MLHCGGAKVVRHHDCFDRIWLLSMPCINIILPRWSGRMEYSCTPHADLSSVLSAAAPTVHEDLLRSNVAGVLLDEAYQ